MLTKVDHIDLRVPDLEETVKFLKSLGLIEKRRCGEPRCSVEMQLPGEDQVVFEIRNNTVATTEVAHIAFRVSDDKVVDVLESQGIKFKKKNSIIKDTGRTVSNIVDYSGQAWQLTD